MSWVSLLLIYFLIGYLLSVILIFELNHKLRGTKEDPMSWENLPQSFLGTLIVTLIWPLLIIIIWLPNDKH